MPNKTDEEATTKTDWSHGKTEHGESWLLHVIVRDDAKGETHGIRLFIVDEQLRLTRSDAVNLHRSLGKAIDRCKEQTSAARTSGLGR